MMGGKRWQFGLVSIFVATTISALSIRALCSLWGGDLSAPAWKIFLCSVGLICVLLVFRHRHAIHAIFVICSSHRKMVTGIGFVALVVAAAFIALDRPCCPKEFAVDYEIVDCSPDNSDGATREAIILTIGFRNVSTAPIWYSSFKIATRSGESWLAEGWEFPEGVWERLNTGEESSFDVYLTRDIRDLKAGMKFTRWNGQSEEVWSDVLTVPKNNG